MSKMIDLTGQKFGRWTVIERAPNTSRGQTRWHCRCECGNEGDIHSTSLKRGDGGSCGCLKMEALIARSTKHNHATNGISPTYHSWAGMKARCTNPNHRSYPGYGGRGIRVCERWESFENFLSDMGEKPKGLSLDRIDFEGPYSPENCRWATNEEQARNKTNSIFLDLNGSRKSIHDWSKTLSIPVATIRDRLGNGKSVAEALSTIRLGSRPH